MCWEYCRIRIVTRQSTCPLRQAAFMVVLRIATLMILPNVNPAIRRIPVDLAEFLNAEWKVIETFERIRRHRRRAEATYPNPPWSR